MKYIITVCILTCSILTTSFGDITLLPKDVEINKGGALKYQGKPSRIGNWKREIDYITFQIPDLNKGKYKLILQYTAGKKTGGQIQIEFNEQQYKKTIREVDNANEPHNLELGIAEHTGGAVTIKIKALRITKQKLLTFHGLKLVEL